MHKPVPESPARVVPEVFADLVGDEMLVAGQADTGLRGSRCDSCGLLMIGRRIVCSGCMGGALSQEILPGSGTLYSFTTLAVGNARVIGETLGYVDLDEGARVLGVVRLGVTAIQIGSAVELAVADGEWFFRTIAMPEAGA